MSGSSITSRNRGGGKRGTERSPWVVEWSDEGPVSFRPSSRLHVVDALSQPCASTLVDQAYYGFAPPSIGRPVRIEDEVPVVDHFRPPSESTKAKAGNYRSGPGVDGINDRASRCRSKDADRFAGKAAPQSVSKMIQVAPGLQAVLRGSHETWEAIQDDFYIPCQCFVCNVTLFVIQVAAYVLCPRCLSIVSLEGDFINRTVSGIGMGFTIEDLMRWQFDLLNHEVKYE